MPSPRQWEDLAGVGGVLYSFLIAVLADLEDMKTQERYVAWISAIAAAVQTLADVLELEDEISLDEDGAGNALNSVLGLVHSTLLLEAP